MVRVDQINGIHLHYARLTQHPYGTIGQRRKFSINSNFLRKLEAAFDEVFTLCPLKKPKVITTAGIFVNKPGQHGVGKAFDLDAIFWKNQSLITKNFPHQKILYLGIESILRKHFGLVLNYNYPNHKDHWHFDSSVPVDFNKGSQSETLFVQMALTYIYENEVLIDGLWGPQTQRAIRDTLKALQINQPITTKANYLKFLDFTGKIAFTLSEEKTTPFQLLDNLFDVVHQLPNHHRNEIEQALNSFMNHEDTDKWLDNMDGNTHHDLDKIIEDLVA